MSVGPSWDQNLMWCAWVVSVWARQEMQPPVAGGEDEFLGVAGVAPAGAQGEVGPFGVEDGREDSGVGGEFGEQVSR